MFYLVGQLKRAGFTLKEVESAVFNILEEDRELDATLRTKAHAIHGKRLELDDQLLALECLEDAVDARPSDRLYAVMKHAMMRSIVRVTEQVAREQAIDVVLAERVRVKLSRAVEMLLAVLRDGKDASAYPWVAKIRHQVRQHAESYEGSPTADDKRLMVELTTKLVEESLTHTSCEASTSSQKRAARTSGRVCDAAGDEVGTDGGTACVTEPGMQAPLMECALCIIDRFLAEAENGVPIELVFGEGSFAHLGKTARACVADIDQ